MPSLRLLLLTAVWLAAVSRSAAEGRVTFVHPAQGTFLTDLQPEDYTRLGIRPGDPFTLHHGAQSHEMRHTEDPENSGDGSVAGPEPEGFVVAVLRGRAAREAKPAEGDAVSIEPRGKRG